MLITLFIFLIVSQKHVFLLAFLNVIFKCTYLGE